ncbi:AAA family ATPase [Pseudomonas capsici]|uniref:AAA family ATPase n=1 Tax=Pseudomonas capsici TaxID=2810614 RepID=A0ABT3C1D8_9PSED|nr:AAA family ATPase [Pseudomonas capsici]MCV4269371.1 AAA family ATPase [Pseudomonas capsici]MCV4279799.1 AAA family ATPase [Pseudomonas capsici]MCV4333080.1 AAA family ATPase [Pseudomonas capsici]MCV4378462.1 AAA family ATPase [Pseudomonas capsici]
MMHKIRPTELKALRKSRGISTEQAARAVKRSIKSWRDYESETAKPKIPDNIFKLFLWKFKIIWPHAKTVSIAAYKGGIGKSPITIALAASFAQTGLKVAIVTNDEVYRAHSKKDKATIKSSSRLAAKIDFYDELDIVLYSGEVVTLEKEVQYRKKLPEAHIFSDELEALARKKAAVFEFEKLRKNYDLIFLDMNRNLTQTLLRSDEIVLLVDSTCPYSPNSTKNFYEQITHLNKEKLESIHILPTNFSSLPRINGQIDVRSAHKNKIFNSCMFDSHLTLKTYRKIRKLSIPILRSRFTSDYEFYFDLHYSNLKIENLSYFDTIIDVAPNSIATLELEQITDELAEILWGMNCPTPSFHFTSAT